MKMKIKLYRLFEEVGLQENWPAKVEKKCYFYQPVDLI
jgi:hypothetical protein